MKKMLVFLLCVLFTFALLTGCSGEEATSSLPPTQGTSEPAAQPTEVPEPEPQVEPAGPATIAETVLFDYEGVRLTARALEDSWMGMDLTVLIENDTETPVTVQVRNASVNGFMFPSTVFSPSVTPGNRANDSISFMSSGLEESQIETIGVIELSFVVFHSETWENIFTTDIITIETSAAGQFTQIIPNTIETVFDQDGIYIAYMGIEESWMGQDVLFFIVNNTDEEITIQVREEAVNGFMVSGIMSATVLPGKMAVDSMGFGSWDLEDNDIEEIEMIEFRFNVFHGDLFRGTSFLSDIIQIHP